MLKENWEKEYKKIFCLCDSDLKCQCKEEIMFIKLLLQEAKEEVDREWREKINTGKTSSNDDSKKGIEQAMLVQEIYDKLIKPKLLEDLLK